MSPWLLKISSAKYSGESSRTRSHARSCGRRHLTGSLDGERAGTLEEPRDELWLGEPEVIEGSIDPGFGVRLNEELL